METENKTIAEQVYDLLNPIPNKNWFTGAFTNEVDKCCSLGHLHRIERGKPDDFSRANCVYTYNKKALSNEFNNLVSKFTNNSIIWINDNTLHNTTKYKQKTPKGRVIALVKDMIKAGL